MANRLLSWSKRLFTWMAVLLSVEFHRFCCAWTTVCLGRQRDVSLISNKSFEAGRHRGIASSIVLQSRQQPEQTETVDESTFVHPAISFWRRRDILSTAVLSVVGRTAAGIATTGAIFPLARPHPSLATEVDMLTVLPNGDARKFFNEGRALEAQGNMAAAQRLYDRVTKMVPNFVYGWSNLGNTQTAFGDLTAADASYSTALNLCHAGTGTRPEDTSALDPAYQRCKDLYVLYMNRGSIRLNTPGRREEALQDLQQATALRGRPDAILLQNLARAKEVNGLYTQADRDYNVAISMTSNEVSPFWLRSALVKYQLGDVQGGYDILNRVSIRFPDAPEVRASMAVFLLARGDPTGASSKFMEIPDRARLKYSSQSYLAETISWPPAMIDAVTKVAKAVGDQ